MARKSEKISLPKRPKRVVTLLSPIPQSQCKQPTHHQTNGSTQRPKLPTQFNCPRCQHQEVVTVDLDRKNGRGSLHCRTRKVEYKCRIYRFSEHVDVYGEFVDHYRTCGSNRWGRGTAGLQRANHTRRGLGSFEASHRRDAGCTAHDGQISPDCVRVLERQGRGRAMQEKACRRRRCIGGQK